MGEKNVIIVPRKYTVGECCVWGYISTCDLGWIGACSHKACSNTLCVKAKKEKSVFYSKCYRNATCIIRMSCERCEQKRQKIILKKDWVKKDYSKTENSLYICEDCEQLATVALTAVERRLATEAEVVSQN